MRPRTRTEGEHLSAARRPSSSETTIPVAAITRPAPARHSDIVEDAIAAERLLEAAMSNRASPADATSQIQPVSASAAHRNQRGSELSEQQQPTIHEINLGIPGPHLTAVNAAAQAHGRDSAQTAAAWRAYYAHHKAGRRAEQGRRALDDPS